MYNVEYLPIAQQDLIGIARYISQELTNPTAAENFADELEEKAETLETMPYAYSAYTPIRPLTHEYRKILVKNYIAFFWVDENTKTVTVARIIYARRNYNDMLR